MSFSLKNVFISDEVDPKCVEVLKENGIGVVKDTELRLNKDKFLAEIPKYDGLIVRSATKVTADIINAATNLKIIGRAGTGVDNIDCDAATKRGIIVMNTPDGNTLSAAEHTCALICSLSRDIPNAAATMRAGNWDRKKFMGSELYGKTLAIIGLGRIGKEVALRMQSFGMKTIGYDPIIPGSVSAQFNVDWMELDEIWPLADYITVHTPLIPQTRNLISDAVFAKCKPTVKVVNCARGGIIDEEALLKALNNNQCGGAALDVYTSEPPKDYTLAQHPKVIPTPHLGASTVEAQKRVAVQVAEQFVDLVNGKSLFGAINAQAMQNALSPDTKPVVELGRCLGTLLAGILGSAPLNVTITTYGASMKESQSYLSAAVLSGLLSNSSSSGGGETVSLNLVSAPALAKSLGVKFGNVQNVVSGKGLIVFILAKFAQFHFGTSDGNKGQLDISLHEKVEWKSESSSSGQYRQMVSVTAGQQTVSGITSSGQALLVSVSGCSFSIPAVLSGPLVFFQTTASQQLLSKVAGIVSTSDAEITGLVVSSAGNGNQWGVINLLAPPSNGMIEVLKSSVQSVFSITV